MAAKKQIRDRIAALIGTDTAAGNRVYPGRIWPLGPENLPAITIHTPETQSGRDNLKGTERHSVTVAITIWAADLPSAPVNDKLDDIAAVVRARIGGDLRGGLPVLMFEPLGEKMETAALGQTACGAMGIVYRATYRTAPGGDEFA